MPTNYKRLAVIVAIAAVLIGAFSLVRYRRYAYAKTWHLFHRANFRFGGHEIQITEPWWVTDVDRSGQILIHRAFRSEVLTEPEIVVGPASPGTVAEDDGEQSRIANSAVSTLGNAPQPGWNHKVLAIQAQEATFFCIETDQTILDIQVSTSLTCNAARFPYSLSYQGPPEWKNEAESIFETLR